MGVRRVSHEDVLVSGELSFHSGEEAKEHRRGRLAKGMGGRASG